MKLTKDYIINHMRQTQYPCWSLFVMQNYKRVPIMHYNGDDWQSDDDAAAKAEKAIARLNGALQSGIPSDALLCIELRSSKGANGSQGTLGPFEFFNRDKEDGEPLTPPATAQQPATFAGFGYAPPPGYVSEEFLNGRLELLERKNEQKIEALIQKQKEKDFKDWAARERAEIADLKKELKEEKRKYESNTGAAAETLVFALKKLLAEVFPNSPVVGALAGTPQQPQTEAASVMGDDEAEATPKFKAVEGLANMLYEDSRVTEADVAKIQDLIKTQLNMNAQAATPGQEDGVENV